MWKRKASISVVIPTSGSEKEAVPIVIPTSASEEESALSNLAVYALIFFLVLLALPLLHAQSNDLPAGPMQAKVTTACTECHEARIIVQQRLSKGTWTKEVDKMIKWGAVVGPSDRDGFIEYLSTNFPPDKAPAQMPRLSAAKK